MTVDFSEPEKAEEDLEKLLKKDLTTLEISDRIAFDNENPISQLYEAVNILKDKASWTKNVGITNKKAEFKRFKEDSENFEPEFQFKPFQYNEDTFVELIDILEGKTQSITKKTIQSYSFKDLEIYQLQRFFEEILQELKLFVKLAANIEDKDEWLNYCEKLWPLVDEETYEKSVEHLKSIDIEDKEEKNLDAYDLKEMWTQELERIGVDYNVEVRDVGGCFNIPEEETVVVANGDEEKRFYSQKEAEMLTMHELFHVVRGYNGRKAVGETGFPPILGVHTPFYDMTEEGGALYREKQTGTNYTGQDYDYNLRLAAAYLVSQDLEFKKVVEKLTEFGAPEKRSFMLAARNREILRHHIYLQGYQEWKNTEDLDKLLIGKLNPYWADIFWKEVENGVLKKPEVTASQLFNFRFEN